jgi:transcriptional regulator with XRE-family HTH domain
MDANGQDTLGRRLRLRRAELGLTLEQLADRTGLSMRGISDIERDRTKAPRRSSWGQALDILSDLRHPDAGAVRAKLQQPG